MFLVDLLSKHLDITDEEKKDLKSLEKLSHFDRAKFFELYCFVQSKNADGSAAERDWMRLSQYYTKALITYESTKNEQAKAILLKFMNDGSEEVDKVGWEDESDKETKTP